MAPCPALLIRSAGASNDKLTSAGVLALEKAQWRATGTLNIRYKKDELESFIIIIVIIIIIRYQLLPNRLRRQPID